MNGLVFGKYLPLDSVIHRLDPRAKIVALFLMIIAIFLPNSFYPFIVIGAVCVLALLLSRVGLKIIIQAFKPMALMMVFLLVINVLTVKQGEVLFTIGSFKVYSEAIYSTLKVIIRLMLMIIITTLLTATTKPLDLTLGIEYLFKPLEVFHFPSHELAMMISIALRFIPTIIEETKRIMDSQKSRGVDFEEGSISEKVTAILSLIVPLFSVAFERAYELADAMEARGYVPGAPRTRYRVLKFKFSDFVLLLVSILTLGFSIYTRFVL